MIHRLWCVPGPRLTHTLLRTGASCSTEHTHCTQPHVSVTAALALICSAPECGCFYLPSLAPPTPAHTNSAPRARRKATTKSMMHWERWFNSAGVFGHKVQQHQRSVTDREADRQADRQVLIIPWQRSPGGPLVCHVTHQQDLYGPQDVHGPGKRGPQIEADSHGPPKLWPQRPGDDVVGATS